MAVHGDRSSSRLHIRLTGLLAALAALGAWAYDGAPPFRPSKLKSVGGKAYDPKDPYAIFVNYELGMHCVGFDISYCCVIPPYNSIQAQAVRTGVQGAPPQLLSPADDVTLAYYTRDNTYSEGNKMRYWDVPKDANGNGRNDDPGDTMANYVWTHLFIYRDLEGTLPKDWSEATRLRVGRQIQVPVDSGPTGKAIQGGTLSYAGPGGSNKVFTDSMIPEVQNVQLTLTASHLWDALGLPLTAFNDSRIKNTMRRMTEQEFQPYQVSVVRLQDKAGKPIMNGTKYIEGFGTNPVDIPNCFNCHSRNGVATILARSEGLTLFDQEAAYWEKNALDMSEFIRRQMQASILILELHDRHFKTELLKNYNPDSAVNRLGTSGAVNCADCHADNVSGNLRSPRPEATGYRTMKARPMTEAIHAAHLRRVPMPDKAGRTQSCQGCHPTHWQKGELNDVSNPHMLTDRDGNPRFSGSDVRIAGGGCYLRRDAHTNPASKPPYFLNDIGRWYLEEVSTRDEYGKPVKELRGLYCTNCHNALSQALYVADELTDAATQAGTTLRDKPLADVIQALAKGDAEAFRDKLADPKVGVEGEPLLSFYRDHRGATLVRASKDEAGKLQLAAWNAKQGEPVPYDAATAGKDWWLSPSEPHCADCHAAPFTESLGGQYFPIDQPNKYSLYRYSKAHGSLACQSCHQSIHGLYPVRFEGKDKSVDVTTHEQALQFSPDGKYDGPVTCSACHRVNARGVPDLLKGTPYEKDYWASVVLQHLTRDEDVKLPVDELVEKFPYERSKAIVERSWR